MTDSSLAGTLSYTKYKRLEECSKERVGEKERERQKGGREEKEGGRGENKDNNC